MMRLYKPEFNLATYYAAPDATILDLYRRIRDEYMVLQAPASQVYGMAIAELTMEASMQGPTPGESQDPQGVAYSACKKWGRAKPYGQRAETRSLHVHALGDRTAAIHTKQKWNPFFKTIQSGMGCWDNLSGLIQDEAGPAEWIQYIADLAITMGPQMVSLKGDEVAYADPVVKGRFPPSHSIVVFDTLNFAVEKDKSTDVYSIGEVTEQHLEVMDRLFLLMSKFDNALYVCTSRGARWDIKGGWEEAVAKIRPLAQEHNIQCWDGDWFWESLLPWRVRAGKETSIRPKWHGEPSDRYNLVQRWEDLMFRIGELFNYTCLDLREREKYWYALCQSSEELLSPAYYRSVAKEPQTMTPRSSTLGSPESWRRRLSSGICQLTPMSLSVFSAVKLPAVPPGVRPVANPTLAEMLPAVPLGVRPAAARTSV